MARPKILIKEDLLKKLHEELLLGVKYSTLIDRHDLNVAPATIQKILSHYAMYLVSKEEAKSAIKESLFPEWLVDNVQRQDTSEYAYIGNMPTGRWVARRKI